MSPLEEAERALILKTLRSTAGSKSEAAKLLGISMKRLSSMLLENRREELRRAGAGSPQSLGKKVEFPIPVGTCQELCKLQGSIDNIFRPAHERDWPIPRGNPGFSGCFAHLGPRQGVARTVLRSHFQFASGPVLTPSGIIIIANTGDDLNLTRIYPLQWNSDRGDFDWVGMHFVPRLETYPALFAIGKERSFAFTSKGAQEAWIREANVHPIPISASSWADFPDFSSALLLHKHLGMMNVRLISESGASIEARFSSRMISDKICPWGVILPVGCHRIVTVVGSKDRYRPLIWTAFFLVNSMQETMRQASLLTILFELERNAAAIARTAGETVTQAVLPSMPVYGGLSKVFIVCSPESKADSVKLWYSDIPPILFSDGRVAVVHWPELIVFSPGQKGKYRPQKMFLLPSVDRPSAMVADCEGFIYLAIGNKLIALAENQRIAWTVDCEEPIIGEPVIVAPGILLVAAGSKLLLIQ